MVQKVSQAFGVLDGLSIGGLLLLAMAVYVGTGELRKGTENIAATVASGLFLVAYFVHSFPTEGEFWDFVEVFIRSLCAREVSHGAFLVIVALYRYLKAEIRWVKQRLDTMKHRLADRRAVRLAKEEAERRIEAKAKAAKAAEASVVSRLEKLQSLADSVQGDFDNEVAALDRMKLDKNERSVLYVRARQRLLKRLEQFGET